MPMTYVHNGRQFVVMGVRGSATSGAQLHDGCGVVGDQGVVGARPGTVGRRIGEQVVAVLRYVLEGKLPAST